MRTRLVVNTKMNIPRCTMEVTASIYCKYLVLELWVDLKLVITIYSDLYDLKTMPLLTKMPIRLTCYVAS